MACLPAKWFVTLICKLFLFVDSTPSIFVLSLSSHIFSASIFQLICSQYFKAFPFPSFVHLLHSSAPSAPLVDSTYVSLRYLHAFFPIREQKLFHSMHFSNDCGMYEFAVRTETKVTLGVCYTSCKWKWLMLLSLSCVISWRENFSVTN